MSAPQRIQRKRTKGWRMPEGAVYVGRPTKWGNPFSAGEMVARDDWRWVFIEQHARLAHGQGFTFAGFSKIAANRVEDVVAIYDLWLAQYPPLIVTVADELRGHDLVCWCPLDQPCHADVLLELANA